MVFCGHCWLKPHLAECKEENTLYLKAACQEGGERLGAFICSVMSCADPGTGWVELFLLGTEGKVLSVRRSLSPKPLPLWWTTKWAPIFLLAQLLEKSLTSYFASKRGRAEYITLWRKSGWCGWFREKRFKELCSARWTERLKETTSKFAGLESSPWGLWGEVVQMTGDKLKERRRETGAPCLQMRDFMYTDSLCPHSIMIYTQWGYYLDP